MATGRKIPALVLFVIAAALLCCGWLMKSFPVLIFFGIAPLFAITDEIKQNGKFWNSMELVLSGLVVCYLSAHVFNMSFLVISLTQAIIITLAFIGYALAFQSLETDLAKVPIILFWLALEYVLVNLPWRGNFIYLGDALMLSSQWTGWTHHTGYLGVTAWILVVNLIVYFAFFRGDKINFYLIAGAVSLIVAPLLFSYLGHDSYLSRSEMIAIYGKPTSGFKNYFMRGEILAVFAVGLSGVLLIVSFIKNKNE